MTSALRHAQRDQRGGWLAAEKVVSELRWARVVPNEMMKTVQETLRSKGDLISKLGEKESEVDFGRCGGT